MLLPRRLISLSSWVIESVGKETEITSPPVKYGFTFWRSGDIMFMRQTSLASAGTVTSSRSSMNRTASSASSLISRG
jgi:hypothetical protein